HQNVTAYFPCGEMAVTDLLEGQLAFLSHIKAYEDSHLGTRLLQKKLAWKYEFLFCCLGCLSQEHLQEIVDDIGEISNMWSRLNGLAVRKFFAFLMANSKVARGERLTLQRCEQLGRIFRAGLASGTAATSSIYAKLDVGAFFNHGHELYLTDNGVVLSYADVAPIYLTYHYRPPHEKDPGGLKHEQKQRAAGVSSCFEEAIPPTAAASSSVKAAEESPSGKEAALRSTAEEGTTRYSYKLVGDTVHGRVDATRLQQEEELKEILQKARYNPWWHLFQHGLLRRVDSTGNKMHAPYGDALVKTTPFNALPTDMRKLLGSEYNWAFELGKMQGNLLVELTWKEKAYTNGYRMSGSQCLETKTLETRSRTSELMNAMLHYFLAAGVDEEELGDLSLD
ncbi:unnamed protein product, partial [Symbiodinium necroappetens]